MQVSQRQPPLAVQTAGNHRAVAQHGDLLAQTVAVFRVRPRVLRVARPAEALRLLDIGAVHQPPVAHAVPGQQTGVHPGQLPQNTLDLAVELRLRALVPQAQRAHGAPLPHNITGIEAAPQIRLQRHVRAVALVGVEGDAQLVQRRRIPQDVQLFGQQQAVGGYAGLEAQLAAYCQHLVQIRVQQRLAHDVQVQIVRQRAQLFRRRAEVRQPHGHGRTGGAGAEITVEVAQVGDLDIRAIEHGRLSFRWVVCPL